MVFFDFAELFSIFYGSDFTSSYLCRDNRKYGAGNQRNIKTVLGI